MELRIRNVFVLLLCFAFAGFPVVTGEVNTTNTTHASSSSTNQDGIVQVLENEIWDASSNSWKNSGERWTNERGQTCLSPPAIKPPEGFEFEGDWKIVLSGGDSWEYQFKYLQPPKRRRIWLRTLRRQQPQKSVSAISKPRRPSTILSRNLARVRDDYNFKGFGISAYKSLIFPASFGVALRLPLTMNFDWWDRHPELPSVSSSVALYFPGTIGAFLSTSVHVEWVKWVLKCILGVLPRLLILGIYQLVLPFFWILASTLCFPIIRRKLPPLPKAPKLTIAKPRYNPELSERIGCSVSYRWSIERGFEWRLSYWHSYLPTLMVYRQLLRMKTPLDWWLKHAGSVGLSSGYPMPTPPHFSCSACLSLSGLYWKSGDNVVDDSTTITVEKDDPIEEKNDIQEQQEPIVSSRLVTATKKESWS